MRVFDFFMLARSVTLHTRKTAIFNYAKSFFWSTGRAAPLGRTWAFMCGRTVVKYSSTFDYLFLPEFR